jgi:hypothetical protein
MANPFRDMSVINRAAQRVAKQRYGELKQQMGGALPTGHTEDDRAGRERSG